MKCYQLKCVVLFFIYFFCSSTSINAQPWWDVYYPDGNQTIAWNGNFEKDYAFFVENEVDEDFLRKNNLTSYCSGFAYQLRAIFSYRNKLPFRITSRFSKTNEITITNLSNREEPYIDYYSWDSRSNSYTKETDFLNFLVLGKNRFRNKDIEDCAASTQKIKYDTYPIDIKMVRPGDIFLEKEHTHVIKQILADGTIIDISVPAGLHANFQSRNVHKSVLLERDFVECSGENSVGCGFRRFIPLYYKEMPGSKSEYKVTQISDSSWSDYLPGTSYSKQIWDWLVIKQAIPKDDKKIKDEYDLGLDLMFTEWLRGYIAKSSNNKYIHREKDGSLSEETNFIMASTIARYLENYFYEKIEIATKALPFNFNMSVQKLTPLISDSFSTNHRDLRAYKQSLEFLKYSLIANKNFKQQFLEFSMKFQSQISDFENYHGENKFYVYGKENYENIKKYQKLHLPNSCQIISKKYLEKNDEIILPDFFHFNLFSLLMQFAPECRSLGRFHYSSNATDDFSNRIPVFVECNPILGNDIILGLQNEQDLIDQANRSFFGGSHTNFISIHDDKWFKDGAKCFESVLDRLSSTK